MKLGIVTYNIAHDWSLDTLLDRSEALGYDCVELRTTHAHGVELALDAAGRAAVRERFAASPVDLWGLGTTCEFHSPDPADVQRNMTEALHWIALARELGATGVKVRPNGMPDGVPPEKTLRQIGEVLSALAPAARANEVELWLEVHGPVTADPRHIATILGHVDSSTVGACWNCNFPSDLIDGKLAPGFDLLKERILAVHLHDFHEPYPYRELFERLAAIGYDRPCLAEIQDSPDPERVLRYFRACFLELTGQTA